MHALDWFFRNRETGHITIGQCTNLPLWVFGAASVIDWLSAPKGSLGDVIRGIGAGALAIWALDELARGVNPWRRCLGASVFAGLLWNWGRVLV